jgi:RimJ/RimL family protein N-acetyltransferase
VGRHGGSPASGLTSAADFKDANSIFTKAAGAAVMPSSAMEVNTQRLVFRLWQDRHRAPFTQMNRDAEVMRYFPALQTPEQSNSGIDMWIGQFAAQVWSNWVVELEATGELIGFIGLSVPKRQLRFSPCVEIGWRLNRSAWGYGYATERSVECLRVGFEQLDLNEAVSFTTVTNAPSIALMQRIGMLNANADFEHPALPEGHTLRPHCLYKISRATWSVSADFQSRR